MKNGHSNIDDFFYLLSVDIKNGNKKSFKSLFDHFCKPLIYFSIRIVNEQEIAENIVQDVFLNLWQRRDQIDPEKNLKTFLFTSVKNNSLKYLRHYEVEKKYSEEVNSNLRIIKSPYQLSESEELKSVLHKTINSLPERCREIFQMAKFDNLKYSEISEILDISIKTVENQMGKAFKVLRENLKHLVSFILIFLSEKF